MATATVPRERRLTVRSRPGEIRSGVLRYRDPRFDAVAVKIFPGDHYVTGTDEMLVTVLGSCVAACMRDPEAGVGGMNHFMLPEAAANDSGERAAAHGALAMERLISDILDRGGSRERLEIRVFGGANLVNGGLDGGSRAASFVEGYLCAAGLPVLSADLGGTMPRRIHYFPVSGKVLLLELRRSEDVVVVENETRYRVKLQRP